MAATGSRGVQVLREDGVVRLVIQRPPRNLLDPEVMRELLDALRDADEDPDVRAIAITGEGELFCGGLDIAQIRAGADPAAFGDGLVELLRIFPHLGKPVIAAVNGDALAAGYGLVCAADLAIAVDDARLGTFEASVGVWPMVAQVPALKLLHPRFALENIITGEPFDAQRAREVGIVNRVVAAGELWDEVARWVEMSTRAGAALAVGRRSFYAFGELSYDDALTASAEAFRAVFRKI